MACNMRCRHCGSACAERLPDELLTDEALKLCDELIDMGLLHLTLSGGEPLLRKDWGLIAARLSGQGVKVTMISNGWFVDEAVIEKARRSGVSVIGVSLDGLEETHDFMRRPGAFKKVCKALETMAQSGFQSAVVTTLIKRNLPELPELYHVLTNLGVRQWQLQFGNPMGSFAEHRDELIEPDDVLSILEFVQKVHAEGKIIVDPSDCLGYYTKIDTTLRQSRFFDPVIWQGCGAGKFVIGIRHNGDICGCNSLRDDAYIEGNIRDIPLRELWTRPGAFAWNRDRTRESLTGFCRICQYGDICLAGCTSTRLTLGGFDGEYHFCAYRIPIENLFPKIDRMDDPRKLVDRADRALELGIPEAAQRCLMRAARMEPCNMNLLDRLRVVESRLKGVHEESAETPA